MKNVKLNMKVRIPSWNFCTLDEFTANGRYSKETCRFCQRTKGGYKCSLYDEVLAADPTFVHKCQRCIRVSAGFPDEELQAPSVDPALIMKETIKQYKKTVQQLLAQGYPQTMAENIAEQFTIGGRR